MRRWGIGRHGVQRLERLRSPLREFHRLEHLALDPIELRLEIFPVTLVEKREDADADIVRGQAYHIEGLLHLMKQSLLRGLGRRRSFRTDVDTFSQ
ncbi:MAG: hypothetical protein BGO24_02485 [Sphingomonas sp. 67-36]|nr:MAG: hypothetical protein BGO24_02485 [Sphingomonas sp. 67-36]